MCYLHLIRLFSVSDTWISNYGALVEWYWQGKTEFLGENLAPWPLCPPQIYKEWPGFEPGSP